MWMEINTLSWRWRLLYFVFVFVYLAGSKILVCATWAYCQTTYRSSYAVLIRARGRKTNPPPLGRIGFSVWYKHRIRAGHGLLVRVLRCTPGKHLRVPSLPCRVVLHARKSVARRPPNHSAEVVSVKPDNLGRLCWCQFMEPNASLPGVRFSPPNSTIHLQATTYRWKYSARLSEF